VINLLTAVTTAGTYRGCEKIKSHVDTVAMAWGLACDQKAHRSKTLVEGLVRLMRRDFDAFSGVKNEGLVFDFEGQDSVEDVEELPRMEVIVATLTCAGRHELFDDAKVGRFDQMPAVAVGSEIAAPLVVFGSLCASVFRHRGNRPGSLSTHSVEAFEGWRMPRT
jgi:hypothetical protein